MNTNPIVRKLKLASGGFSPSPQNLRGTEGMYQVSPRTPVTSRHPDDWQIDSWKGKPIAQQPEYEDPKALEAALDRVRSLPQLVQPEEIRALRQQLAEVAEGRRFLLQGGDCAERFVDCTSEKIESKIKILLQMSMVITWGSRMPTVKIGRIAGQYGKPRSSSVECLATGEVINSFKGDNVNDYEADRVRRTHDPNRLVDAHFYSSATLNYVRGFTKSGMADLKKLTSWNLDFVKSPSRQQKYREITNRITDSLSFLDSIGMSVDTEATRQVDFYCSHEGLLLDYEAACTKVLPSGEAFDLSSHFLWIGERTRSLDGAHVEFFRGLSNPIGVKIGPSMTPEELITLLFQLNPNCEPGKVTLITRFGAKNVKNVLPQLIRAVHQAGLSKIVIWSCDPMHGNTYSASSGLKTRSFDDILTELTVTFHIHQDFSSFLGGIHFEMTGEHVTECVGGPEELEQHDLTRKYTTYCDPRLNYSQSLSMSFCLAELLRHDLETGRTGEKRTFSHPPLLTPTNSVLDLQRLYGGNGRHGRNDENEENEENDGDCSTTKHSTFASKSHSHRLLQTISNSLKKKSAREEGENSCEGKFDMQSDSDLETDLSNLS